MYSLFLSFFFNDTATTEIYTLSLHDALPISRLREPGFHPDVHRPSAPQGFRAGAGRRRAAQGASARLIPGARDRSEEHTSELQSRVDLVCRLLLEKKKKYRSQVG